MSNQEWNLPSEISNSTLRRVQRALDKDFRVAIDNNRADRRADRGLAGELKAPNTRGKTRQIRADTASLVNDRLKESWLGQARVAFNWLWRQIRRREGREAVSAPYDRADYPAAGEHQRPPLTKEQVDRWAQVLDTQQLNEREQRSVKSAIAAAYLVLRNPDLGQLYQKEPREMQNLAEIIKKADEIAAWYEPQPTAQHYLPPPQQNFDFGFEQHVPSTSPTSPRESTGKESDATLPSERDRSVEQRTPQTDRSRAAYLTTISQVRSRQPKESLVQRPARRMLPGPADQARSHSPRRK